uniref:Putative lipocalin-3 1 n=1 Tax=Amblyomma triste TaxID=251400 RepID=A0A023GAR9_AMBTT
MLLAFTLRIGTTNDIFPIKITDNGEDLDIRKVLNSTDMFWLYWESTKNSFDVCMGDRCIEEVMTCIRIKTISISMTQYKFMDIERLEGKDVGTPYVGTFIPEPGSHPPKSMRVVSAVDPEDPQLYTIQYTNDGDFKCNVFFVASLGARIANELETCKMYIPDSDIDKGPSESCKRFFMERCNKTKIYQPYHSSCKNTENSLEK